MIKPSEAPATTIALAVSACIGALLLAASLLPSLVIGGTTPPRTAYRFPAFPETDHRPDGDYAIIADRPLFNPGRQKDPAAPAEAGKLKLPPLSDYRLAGIVLMKDVKIALVEKRASKSVVTLHSGDDLDGRRVVDIGPAGIALSGENGMELLAMPRVNGISRDNRYLSRGQQ